MQFIILCHGPKEEFVRVMRLVLLHGTKVERNVDKDIDHIYISFENNFYKFNRYNTDFIASVKHAIETSPYPQYEGPLHVYTKDARFPDNKYYNIARHGWRSESVELNKDLIINDLYN